MHHVQSVLRRQTAGDQRSVTGARVGLDAQKDGGHVFRQRRLQLRQIERVEDLLGVPLDVARIEALPGALADAGGIVGRVLQLPQLGRRCEVANVAVRDAGRRERAL